LGIGNSRNAKKMALLANTVASRRREFGRVDYVPGTRFGEVSSQRTVTAIAADSLLGKNRLTILVERAGNGQRTTGMAEHAFFADWARKVWVGNMLIAWSEVIGLTSSIKGDGRLKEMSADLDEIARRVVAGANDVVDAKFAGFAGIFPALKIAVRRRTHGDARTVGVDRACGLFCGAAEGMRHCGARVSGNFVRMAECAAAGFGRGVGSPRDLRVWNAKRMNRRTLRKHHERQEKRKSRAEERDEPCERSDAPRRGHPTHRRKREFLVRPIEQCCFTKEPRSEARETRGFVRSGRKVRMFICGMTMGEGEVGPPFGV
jgi:hypothetical protein